MLDQKDPLKYGKYVYPGWAVGIGWAITLFVMLQIPFWAAVSIYRAPGNTFLQVWTRLRICYRASQKVDRCVRVLSILNTRLIIRSGRVPKTMRKKEIVQV